MKHLFPLLLSVASVLSVSQPAHAMGRRNATPAITPEQLANAPEAGQLIQGGAQAGNGLWSGPVMQSAVSGRVVNAKAELVAAISFGEDVAPDAQVIDTAAIEGKNNLDAAIKALSASKNPQAAAAAALAGPALKAMEAAMKPVPQGDRKGAQGIFLMRGDSDDVRNYGESLNEFIAAIRLKQQPRANASETTTRTEKSEWTENALEIAGKYADRITSNYWAFTLASQSEDEKEVEEATGDPQTPAPIRVDDQGTVAPADRNGSQAFLWKPVSDSNGNLVVLLPAKFNGLIDSPATIAGERGAYTSTANGNRAHFRFSKPGAAYGSNVVVTWGAGGKTYRVTVPSGDQRWQTDDVANPVVPTPVSEMPKPEVPAGQGESPAP